MDSVTCLLVDDDRDDREFFCMAVEEMGLPVECLMAEGGQEALDMLHDLKSLPDYVFMDMNMPRMSGIECLERIRSDIKLKELRVIMFSTSSDKTIVQRTTDAGANSFLTKPIHLKDLSASLSQIIQPDLIS